MPAVCTADASNNYPTTNCTLADAPAAVLPDGNILFAASNGYGDPGTHFFEFSSATSSPANSIAQVSDPLENASTQGAYTYNLLELPNGQILMRIALEVSMPLAFTWLLLALARRRARFLQTGSALLGVGAIAALILYPLDSIIRVLGEDKLASLPIGVIWTAVFIGYLLACAHIWRSALDSGLLLGVAISLGYFVLSFSIDHRLLAQS